MNDNLIQAEPGVSAQAIDGISGKPLTVQQKEFLKSEKGKDARQVLTHMVADPAFNTADSFNFMSAGNGEFVNKHMIYLCEHPKLSIEHYLSNLRLKTRIRT